MQIDARLPPYLWDEFYLTASHLHTRSLKGCTPWELWFERKPDYSYLHEIGCRAFILIPKKDNPKIFECSIECVLIGYDPKSKSYRCYDCATQKIHSSYHVRFLESHDGHVPLAPTNSENDETVNPAAGDEQTFRPFSPNDDDDDLPLIEQLPPNQNDHIMVDPPHPKPPCCSSRIPIPTEKHPSGGPDITRTAAAVQELRESAAQIKEARLER